MLVRRLLGVRRRQSEAAAHPQVDHQRQGGPGEPAVQLDQQVLRPPLQPFDAPAGQSAQRLVVERFAQLRRMHLDPLDGLSRQPLLEAAAQDFDFRQLGHGPQPLKSAKPRSRSETTATGSFQRIANAGSL
jgi:hypothetical protein